MIVISFGKYRHGVTESLSTPECVQWRDVDPLFPRNNCIVKDYQC